MKISFFPLVQIQCIIPMLLLFTHKPSGGSQRLYQQLYNYTLSCAKPAHDYFWLMFYNDLKLPLNTFKTDQFFFLILPRVCEHKPTSIDIEDLKVFPFLTPLILDNLKAVVPKY